MRPERFFESSRIDSSAMSPAERGEAIAARQELLARQLQELFEVTRTTLQELSPALDEFERRLASLEEYRALSNANFEQVQKFIETQRAPQTFNISIPPSNISLDLPVRETRSVINRDLAGKIVEVTQTEKTVEPAQNSEPETEGGTNGGTSA